VGPSLLVAYLTSEYVRDPLGEMHAVNMTGIEQP